MYIVVYAVWWYIKDIIYKKNDGMGSFKVIFCRFNFYMRRKKVILWLPQSLFKLLLSKQRIKCYNWLLFCIQY